MSIDGIGDFTEEIKWRKKVDCIGVKEHLRSQGG